MTIMSNTLLAEWSNVRHPIIGMLHLPPLPGSPRSCHGLEQIREKTLRDAEALASGGVHGLMIENFGDVPFYPAHVPAYVAAHMTALACTVRHNFDLPLGINVLRNDGCSALAVAHAAGAQFIRVNVLCGARVTDQGIVQGIAHDLLRERIILRAEHIRIFADIDVKHSAPLFPRPIADEVDDTLARGLADALVVSGTGTGKQTDPKKVQDVKQAAPNSPVFIGSGATERTIDSLLPHCDGFIVGTSLKRDGAAGNDVDVNRVRALVARLR
jgi:uncharacterized protein